MVRIICIVNLDELLERVPNEDRFLDTETHWWYDRNAGYVSIDIDGATYDKENIDWLIAGNIRAPYYTWNDGTHHWHQQLVQPVEEVNLLWYNTYERQEGDTGEDNSRRLVPVCRCIDVASEAFSSSRLWNFFEWFQDYANKEWYSRQFYESVVVEGREYSRSRLAEMGSPIALYNEPTEYSNWSLEWSREWASTWETDLHQMPLSMQELVRVIREERSIFDDVDDEDDDDDEDEDEEGADEGNTFARSSNQGQRFQTGNSRNYHYPIRSGEAMSIELECNVPQRNQVSLAEYLVGEGHIHQTVEDGSLNDSLGMELVFGSVASKEIKAKVELVSRTLHEYNAKGYDAGSHYGIHISVSRRRWKITDAAALRVVMLVDNNKPFFEMIAQRKENRWTYYGEATTCVEKNLEKVQSTEKYKAVAFRSEDRIEFRLFRSNTRMDRIMKNVETVSSTLHYCKELWAHQLPTLDGYLAFLAVNKGHYPYLVGFLKEKGVPMPEKK